LLAQKRMFSKKITDTDKFLDMPLSSQALYFHLNMDGDDDGFVGNVKTVKRKIGASDDDLKILIAKNFIVPFESGVIVIKDWRIHNTLRNDRYNPTIYTEEKSLLEQGSCDSDNQMATSWQPIDNQMEPQQNLTELNETELNGTKENTLSSSDELDHTPYKEIIDYLNEKAETNYKASTKKTRTLILARSEEGFTLEDFKKAIDNKVSEWIDSPEYVKFLRPETLFGTKFESYLNQKKVVKKAFGYERSDEELSKYKPLF